MSSKITGDGGPPWFHPELVRAIALLYKQLRTPLCPDIEACPCCTTADDKRALYAAPRELLPRLTVAHYAFKAMTTWGLPEDYRHFLPRILEFAAEGHADIGFDFDVITSKFEWGHFDTWPEHEREAICVYFFALWEDLLVHEDSRSASEVLAAAANVCGSATYLLDRLILSESMAAALRAAELVIELVGPSPNAHGDQERWRWHSHRDEVVRRLSTGAVRDKLEQAFFANMNHPQSGIVADAVDLLVVALDAR